MVMFTLGTGVGGGIIIGDLLVEGENSAGAELGHMIIDYHDDAADLLLRPARPPRGLCQRHGGGEADGRSPGRRPRRARYRHASQAGEELSALMIDQEAERGDALSLEIVLDTARYLGIGVVTAMHADRSRRAS